MNYQTFKPKAGLAHLVRFFWILEGKGPYTHFSLPDACAELIFHVKGKFNEPGKHGAATPSFTAGLHAQSRQTRNFNTSEDFEIIGAYLYPHAVPLLFDIPAEEATDKMIDISTLAGSEGRAAEDAIGNARHNKERIRLLETFIERCYLKKDQAMLPVFKSIQLIIEKRGLVKIADLPPAACLSVRQFKRQFIRYTGFTPKLFSRIVRFHAATELYGNIQAPLSEVAYTCGYYDQAHFINDFREFSGIYPKSFFSGKSGITGWRDVLASS